MQENTEYLPKHKSQFEMIGEYRNRLEKLNPDRKLRIKPITYKEGDGVVRGFRIILNENKTAEKGLITDWDDTLETYSDRKTKYFAGIYKNVDDQSLIDLAKFTEICKAINKSARILNWQKTHPEIYSPLLEMVTESQLIEDFNTFSQEKTFLELLRSPSEETAHNYILNVIVPKFSGAIELEQETKKKYFKESEHQSMAHTLEKKHRFINEEIWSEFNKAMASPNLTQEDIETFDLDDKVYWAISSFGSVEFQLKKILSSLEILAKKGKRMPDEILIVTQGRKRQALLEIRDEKPSIQWTYVDDSERQLEKMKNDDMQLFIAKRSGAKRVYEPSNFKTTNMRESLSKLIG